MLSPLAIQPEIVLRDAGRNVIGGSAGGSNAETCVALKIVSGPKGGGFVGHGVQISLPAGQGVADFNVQPITLDRAGRYNVNTDCSATYRLL